MSMSEVIQDITKWLAWAGSGLGVFTVLAYLFKWGIKYRLTGTTIFTLLLSASRSAPLQIKTPPNAAKVPASPHRFNLLELHSSPMKHYSQTWGS